VRTLRKIYGQHVAEGCGPDEKLSDVLHKLDGAVTFKARARSRAREIDREGCHCRLKRAASITNRSGWRLFSGHVAC
jgi:hypothetical protein